MTKIVLIDDEVRLLATLARFLERQGLEVVRAGSFFEADEYLYPGRFDVLVTDIVMPGFDGMRVLQEVVENRRCQEPVILVTGEPNLETASEAVRSGAFDYIQKPVTKDRLLEVVNRGLRHVKLLRERDEARQREMQLLKNLAQIGESASIITHEIRTPITGLRHALGAVGDKLDVEDGVLIDEFVASLARIERLLGETLSFAKPLMPKWQESDLADVIALAIQECSSLPTFSGMKFHVQCERAFLLRLDPQIFSEVLINLFCNAADACGGSGSIDISARVLGGVICLDVADSGPGVPVDMLDVIFSPFNSSKEYGTGIGLAFSRKVVEAHAGSIELLSGTKGACFRIKLPTSMISGTIPMDSPSPE